MAGVSSRGCWLPGAGLVVLAGLWWAGAASAQSVAPSLPRPIRSEVSVLGADDLSKQVTTRRVVDRDRLEERSARSLDEALHFEPGVYLRTGGDATPRVDLRGLRSRHVLLLVDGIPFNATEDGQFDPALIPAEMMERVELQYGGHSVLYGDGAPAGVIQIETRGGEAGLHGSLGGEARETDQYLGRITLSGGDAQVDYFVSGSHLSGRGFPLSDDFDDTTLENGNVRDNSDRDRSNLFARVGYRPSESLRLGMLVAALDGESGLPPTTIDGGDFAQRVRFERVEDLSGASGQLSFQYAGESLEVRSWIFGNQLEEERNRYDDDGYDSMDDPTVRGTFAQESESRVFGGAFHTRYALGRAGRLKLALQTRRESFEVEGRVRDVRMGGGRFGIRRFDEDHDQDAFSAGLEWEVWPTANTGLVVGYGHAWLDKEQGSTNGANALLGAYWDPWPDTRLRASATHMVRFPSLRQLHDVEGGNPDLDPEHTWSFELGFHQRLPFQAELDVAAFLTEARDFIERIPPDDWFENNDHYRFRGVEATLEARPVDPLQVRIYYGFLDSENRTHDSRDGELQNRPRHRYGLESRLDLPAGLAARLAVSRVEDEVTYSRTEPLQRRSLDDYTRVDLKLSKSFRERLDVYVAVENLFDEDYEQAFAIPREGRVVFAGLEGRF